MKYTKLIAEQVLKEDEKDISSKEFLKRAKKLTQGTMNEEALDFYFKKENWHLLPIHSNGDKSVMRWIDDFACFAGVLFLEDEHQYYQKIDENKLEIIGNVFENPNLLS